jgi:hypothetical protein
MSDDIKGIVKEFVRIDDEITLVNKQVKDIRKKRSELEHSIKEYMIENSISKVDIGNGALKISKSKAAKKVNKQIILSTLLENLDHEKADAIINHLFTEDTDAEEIVKLQRTGKKV